ncbi:MAG: hypothetical protein ACLGJB_11805 [Blastocatellia bacterium]
MSRQILMAAAAVAVWAAVGQGWGQARGTGTQGEGQQAERETQSAARYIAELASRYDCFVTLEEAAEEGEVMSRIASYEVGRPARGAGLEQELEWLRRAVPSMDYEVSEGARKVVHIIDTRLMYRDGYGVDAVIGSIDFEGTVNDLVAAIAKQGIPVSSLGLVSTHEQLDYSTVVRVKGEGMKVRDALTRFVPLEGRVGRFLWVARTKLAKGEKTYIHYPWAGNKPRT